MYRDTENMALISRDVNGFNNYKTQRKVLQQRKEEIDTLKLDVCEIKQMLQRLIGKNNG